MLDDVGVFTQGVANDPGDLGWYLGPVAGLGVLEITGRNVAVDEACVEIVERVLGGVEAEIDRGNDFGLGIAVLCEEVVDLGFRADGMQGVGPPLGIDSSGIVLICRLIAAGLQEGGAGGFGGADTLGLHVHVGLLQFELLGAAHVRGTLHGVRVIRGQ